MFTPPSIFQNWQIWHQNKLTFIWNNLLWRQGKWTTPNIHRNNVLLITCGLLRHLRDSGVNNKYYLDIKRFKICWVQRILDSGRKELLWRGLGTKAKKTETNFPEDEENIWNTGIFVATNSEALQCTLCFYACQLYGLRGNDEHHDLMCDQYSLGEDTNGRYVECTGRATQTYTRGTCSARVGPCAVCPSLIQGFWLPPLWYFQALFIRLKSQPGIYTNLLTVLLLLM